MDLESYIENFRVRTRIEEYAPVLKTKVNGVSMSSNIGKLPYSFLSIGSWGPLSLEICFNKREVPDGILCQEESGMGPLIRKGIKLQDTWWRNPVVQNI